MSNYFSTKINQLANTASGRIEAMLFYPTTLWHKEVNDKAQIYDLPQFKTVWGNARVTYVHKAASGGDYVICEGILESTGDDVNCVLSDLDDIQKCLLADLLEPLY